MDSALLLRVLCVVVTSDYEVLKHGHEDRLHVPEAANGTQGLLTVCLGRLGVRIRDRLDSLTDANKVCGRYCFHRSVVICLADFAAHHLCKHHDRGCTVVQSRACDTKHTRRAL